MPPRFRDDCTQPGIAPYPVFVRCPRCQGRAEVLAHISVQNPAITFDARPLRVVCPQCAFSEVRERGHFTASSAAVDQYTGLPLWLQTPCAGHVLWAWNGDHLDFLERYVAADLRERTPNANVSLASRLPRWIKSAKHRDEVLKGVRRLRKRLAEGNAAT